MLPSQLLDETRKTESESELKLNSFTLGLTLGIISLKGVKKANIANIAKGILLLVSLISSETLMLINISIRFFGGSSLVPHCGASASRCR
jgi:hypothetical protein